MRKFRCKICGYVFDEALGLPEAGIKPGTKWEEIPEEFVCPLCGAPKSAFVEEVEEKREIEKEENTNLELDELKEYSSAELAVIFSSLAKGAEKQYLEEEKNIFKELSDFFYNKEDKSVSNIDVVNTLNNDINKLFKDARNEATTHSDRGALRAITWAEKVTNLVSTLLDKYKKQGTKFLEGNKIFVCEICGFVYIGKEAPAICPVCKVPREKIHEVM